MPLQATLDTLDGLSEELHEEYEADAEGKFQLKLLKGLVSADKVEDVTGLKSALQKERENNKTLTQSRRALEEQYAGFDPDEFTRLKELEEKDNENKAEKKGEWDKLKVQMTDKHTEELGKRDAREAKLLTALERKTIDAEAVAALNEFKGNVTLLLPHVKGHVKMVEEDGAFVARVVDDAGNPRVNGDGNFLTVRELVSEMRDQDTYATAFDNTVKSGGGTPPGGGGEGPGGKKGVIPSDLKRSSMITKDKVAFIKEHGEDEFMKLPA
jgi:hypothetical protein